MPRCVSQEAEAAARGGGDGEESEGKQAQKATDQAEAAEGAAGRGGDECDYSSADKVSQDEVVVTPSPLPNWFSGVATHALCLGFRVATVKATAKLVLPGRNARPMFRLMQILSHSGNVEAYLQEHYAAQQHCAWPSSITQHYTSPKQSSAVIDTAGGARFLVKGIDMRTGGKHGACHLCHFALVPK